MVKKYSCTVRPIASSSAVSVGEPVDIRSELGSWVLSVRCCSTSSFRLSRHGIQGPLQTVPLADLEVARLDQGVRAGPGGVTVMATFSKPISASFAMI